jgi:cellulose synthase/poly-beta-1,6-N-acetylglucosamine synthase-like glycosyltransferase
VRPVWGSHRVIEPALARPGPTHAKPLPRPDHLSETSERARGRASRVAVVVASRDRPHQLEGCLRSLRAALRPEDEAIVVDSASRSDRTQRVAESMGLRVVRCTRRGASRARNAGIHATTAPVIAFTDDDCVVDHGWTAAIERGFEDPSTGFVGGRIIPDVPTKLTIAVSVDEQPRSFVRGDDAGALCHGANLAVRRTALEAIQGFDEALGAGAPFHGAEDEDVVWRMLSLGWSGRYVPDALVTHRQWRTLGDSLRLQFAYGIGTGAFAMKIARVEGPPGRTLLRNRLWQTGMAHSWRNLRAGYESGALADLFKTAGVIVGALRGAARPLDRGRYRS